jgi:hypothetical protein
VAWFYPDLGQICSDGNSPTLDHRVLVRLFWIQEYLNQERLVLSQIDLSQQHTCSIAYYILVTTFFNNEAP